MGIENDIMNMNNRLIKYENKTDELHQRLVSAEAGIARLNRFHHTHDAVNRAVAPTQEATKPECEHKCRHDKYDSDYCCDCGETIPKIIPTPEPRKLEFREAFLAELFNVIDQFSNGKKLLHCNWNDLEHFLKETFYEQKH